MKKLYPVIYEWAGKNFAGHAPDIAGCMATAKTLPKMREMLKGALESHLQWMQDDEDTMPEPSATVTVDMAPDPEFPQPPGYYVIVEWLAIAMPPKQKPVNAKTPQSKKSVQTKRRTLQAA